MAALRRNVLADPAVRDAYVTGVQSLKSEFLGPTTRDFGNHSEPMCSESGRTG